jgi:hypothetical protein
MEELVLSILFAYVGRKYIPGGGIAFCDWAKNAVAYCRLHCAQWGVAPPEEGMEDMIDNLKQQVLACKQAPNKVEVAEKNALRKELEDYLRKYLQGTVARNPKVTAADRAAIGLNAPDVTPTPVGPPSGLPGAVVKYLHAGAIELQIVHAEGDFDEKANYGVKIAYDVFSLAAGEPLPADIKSLQRSMFIRRKKQKFIFEKEDSRKTAVFCLRYENSKGEAGQWGPVVSAVIP